MHKRKTKSVVIVVVFMVVGCTVLSALGAWQVKRLYWKHALIERVNQRVDLEPLPLDEVLADGITEELEYRPVGLSGSYDHSQEVYFFATGPNGQSGWNVHTPLLRSDGTVVIVNRGFVPDQLRDPDSRARGLVSGNQRIIGLLRIPATAKPNRFVPDNDLPGRSLFWRSFPDMVELMGGSQKGAFLPVFVDVSDTPLPGGWPKGGSTIISFPNNHLQYAITWFGLAISLLVVGGYFLYSRTKQEP